MAERGGLKILCLGTCRVRVASLWTDARLSDGGDARCMSQLYILEEYMHRLGHRLGRNVLVRDHFDLIAAVDSSRQVIHGSNTTLSLIHLQLQSYCRLPWPIWHVSGGSTRGLS